MGRVFPSFDSSVFHDTSNHVFNRIFIFVLFYSFLLLSLDDRNRIRKRFLLSKFLKIDESFSSSFFFESIRFVYRLIYYRRRESNRIESNRGGIIQRPWKEFLFPRALRCSREFIYSRWMDFSLFTSWDTLELWIIFASQPATFFFPLLQFILSPRFDELHLPRILIYPTDLFFFARSGCPIEFYIFSSPFFFFFLYYFDIARFHESKLSKLADSSQVGFELLFFFFFNHAIKRKLFPLKISLD